MLTNQHLPSSRSLVKHRLGVFEKRRGALRKVCDVVVVLVLSLLLSSLSSLLLLLVGGGAGADCNFEDTSSQVNKQMVAVSASLMNLSDIEFIDVNTLKLTASP